MKNTYEAQIANAIAKSAEHNQIVRIRIDGDSGDALTAIKASATGCEYEYEMLDREGIDRLDVWSRVWRLNISFTEQS